MNIPMLPTPEEEALATSNGPPLGRRDSHYSSCSSGDYDSDDYDEEGYYDDDDVRFFLKIFVTHVYLSPDNFEKLNLSC